MTDPSIDAAQRAWMDRHGPTGFNPHSRHDGLGAGYIAAAREMAKSVQELHRKVLHNGNWVCHTCWQPYDLPQPWPCETAKRVYPSEELER